MADDTSNRGRPDRDRINLEQDHEVAYWSEKFGVSREQLRRAVEKVGPVAKNVERELRG